jgi:hypothetical protein
MQKVDYEKLTTQLDANEQADFKYQERRHPEWTENYQLFRDKVQINRFTQRQSINVPLIKGVIKTVQANTDELPENEFDDLGNDKDKEIAFNEMWKDFVIADHLEIKDVVDKKQDFLYGITHTKFNLVKGLITTEIKEPFDILRDRFADPTDYDNTADHLGERGIYRTLDQLSANPMFDKAAVARLKNFYATKQGLVKSEETTRLMQAKNERMAMMGVSDIDNPQLGTTVVELKADFQKVFDLKDQEQHLHLIVRADKEIVMAKPLMELLNVDFFPFVTWSDDPERNDHYPDGIADIARTPNKLLNAMISALAENRILRNFGMNFYNSSMEGFVPQSYQPTPFGWYGIPVPDGQKIEDVFKAVQIPDMSESLDEMEYVKKLVETAVAANSTVQGETQQSKVTLGEVELALAASKERITSITKFSKLAHLEKGDKWAKIMNANADKIDAITLYKKSHKGNYFEKTVTGKDWKSDKGYTCRVVLRAEKDKQNLEGLQKLNAVKAQFPNNMAMKKISDKKILEFADLNTDQIKEVMDEEEQNMQMMQQQGGAMPGMPPDAAGASPQPQIPATDPNATMPLIETPQPNAIPA